MKGEQMGKISKELRDIIAKNLRDCRMKKYPGRGGAKKCAEMFGVSPQQWSPWERGLRTPDELRLTQLADFFDVTTEYLRRDNSGDSKKGTVPAATAIHNDKKQVTYVPVFVLMPYMPEDMKALYEHFNTTMNGGKISE